MWAEVGAALGTMSGIPGGGALGGAAGSYFDRDKVPGVPSPETRNGADMGADYKNFLDQSYPGTSAWERLGANSPMGAISAAETSAKNAFHMQDRELANRSNIADSTNRAHVIGSSVGLGPEAMQSAASMYDRGPVMPYDTQTRQGRDRLPSEVSRNRSGSYRDRSAGALDSARVPFEREHSRSAKSIIGTDIFSKRLGSISGAFSDVAHSFSPFGAFGKSSMGVGTGRQIFDRIYNRGSRPRRFGRSSS